MTLASEIFGCVCIVGGFVMLVRMQPMALGVGACGAVILGLAYSGAFN